MSSSPAPAALDARALARAIEERDADALTGFYATDAVVTLIDHDHPPSRPQVLDGQAAVGDYYRDVCGRNVDHQVRDLVATDDGVAFTEFCRYPDGSEVVFASVGRVAGGRITGQTAVLAWG